MFTVFAAEAPVSQRLDECCFDIMYEVFDFRLRKINREEKEGEGRERERREKSMFNNKISMVHFFFPSRSAPL